MSEREEIAKMYQGWMEHDDFLKTAMASASVFWAVNNGVHPADLIVALVENEAKLIERLDDALSHRWD